MAISDDSLFCECFAPYGWDAGSNTCLYDGTLCSEFTPGFGDRHGQECVDETTCEGYPEHKWDESEAKCVCADAHDYNSDDDECVFNPELCPVLVWRL